MGCSIRSYLWLCYGVSHQIPKFTEVLTSLGEEEWGPGALSLFAPFVSVVRPSPCIFVLCADRRMPVCLPSVHMACFLLGLLGFTPSPLPGLCSVCSPSQFAYMPCVHTFFCVRETDGDLVATAARGGLLTLSYSRGASFSPGYRKQTS